MSEPGDVVRAAGGVVTRSGSTGREVLLVHRPRYDDWTFPKGKQDPGETDEETALREVAEETGLACVLGVFLGATRYRDRFGRPKIVRYWHMTRDQPHPEHESFHPTDEVDRLHWCSPPEAARLLTYQHDRTLLAALDGVAAG